jgi:uncharacterized protein YbjQ (UPF0145 family)
MDLYAAGVLAQVRDESVRKLDGGGLPVLAERRLAALTGSANGPNGPDGRFTSQLSVSEFALSQAVGLRSVSQVMGTCFYHAQHALDRVVPGKGWAPGKVGHMSETEPWNTTRQKALDRMLAEATLCAADAVVGVGIQQTQELMEGRFDATFECVATGTAVVHNSPAPGRPGPVMTNLSVQDYWKLLQQGFTPVGLVAHSAMIGCVPSTVLHQVETSVRTSEAAQRSWEVREFTEGLRLAHTTAFAQLRAQAEHMGAAGIVGVTVERLQHAGELASSTYKDLVIVVHAMGTAVARGGTPPKPGSSLPITPVRHLDKKGGADS